MNNWITHDSCFTGLYHKKKQIPCQDARICVSTADLTLAIVSDGVGGLSNSHIAANAAVAESEKWFTASWKKMNTKPRAVDLIKNDLLPRLRNNNLAQAQKYGVNVDSMDCNLAFVCILPKFNYALCGVLGDGAVCIFHETKALVITSFGSHSANGTETIMLPDAADRIHLHACDLSDNKYLGFMVMSDGLDGEVYCKNSPFMCEHATLYFNAMLLQEAMQRKNKIDHMLADLPDELDDDISLLILSSAQRTEPYALPPEPTWCCTCGSRNSLDQQFCSNCKESLYDIYHGIDFGSSLANFFYDLNQEPTRERELLNLPPEPHQKNRHTVPHAQKNKPKHSKDHTTVIHATNSTISGTENINTPRNMVIRHSSNTSHTSGSHSQSSSSAKSSQQTSFRSNFPTRELNIPKEAKTTTTPSTGSEHGSNTSENHNSVTSYSTTQGSTENTIESRSTRKTKGFLFNLIAIAAVVYIFVLSIAVVTAHIRISRLTEKIEMLSQSASMEAEPRVVYVVSSNSARVWEINDGIKSNRSPIRLDSGDKLERLDDQVQIIDDVEYIFVCGEKNGESFEGWCNITSLSPVTSQDTP